MFVYVEYVSTLRTTVVEHTQIFLDSTKQFIDPADPDDFNPSDTYRVHACNGDNSVCEYLGAKIIHMTDTVEEMAAFRAQRPWRPTIRQQNGSAQGNEVALGPPMPQGEDHARSVQRQRLIEEVLQEYELSFMPMRAHAAVQSRVLPTGLEQLDGTRHNNNQGQSLLTAASTGDVPRSVHMALKEKHDALARDIKELRSLNGDLQKSLKSKIFRAEGKLIYATSNDVTMTAVPATTLAPQAANGHTSSHGGCAESNVPSEAHPEPGETSMADQPEGADDAISGEADDGTPKVGSLGPDGKVYAGNGFWFPKPMWDNAFTAPTDPAFCFRAANLFWKPEELFVRSVTGKLSNRDVARGTGKPTQPLTPEKLYALKAMFRLYIGNDPLAAIRIKKVRKHLAARLSDMRRPRFMDKL